MFDTCDAHLAGEEGLLEENDFGSKIGCTCPGCELMRWIAEGQPTLWPRLWKEIARRVAVERRRATGGTS